MIAGGTIDKARAAKSKLDLEGGTP
jgi:hypothetical protein